MNQIQMETKGIRTIKYKGGGNDLSYYTYLKKCRYQVQAHFEWNMVRQDLEEERNENKHYYIAKRMIEKGGRRDIFLGTRECQGYVEPCSFGRGKGYYDDVESIKYGLMYHGITYADEAWSGETEGMMTANLWIPEMKNGVIVFPKPEECTLHKTLHSAEMKQFTPGKNHTFVMNETEVI
jgi:CRISPR-associated protein Cas5d